MLFEDCETSVFYQSLNPYYNHLVDTFPNDRCSKNVLNNSAEFIDTELTVFIRWKHLQALLKHPAGAVITDGTIYPFIKTNSLSIKIIKLCRFCFTYYTP